MTIFRSVRLTAALIAIALLAAGAVAGPAPAASTKPVTCPAKKARTAAAVKTCKVKPKRTFKKVIVTATMLPGTHVTAEIPALPLPGGQRILGTPATVDIPMSGAIEGYIVRPFRIGENIDVKFTNADFRLDPVAVLTDPACGNSPTLRINPATRVRLDTSKPSSSVLRYSGFSSAQASVIVRLAYDIRTEPGCDKPLVPAGYVDTPFTDKLNAKVGPRGLLELPFIGEPTALSIGVCLYPGDPTKPCNGGVASYPIKVVVYATVRISLRATNERVSY